LNFPATVKEITLRDSFDHNEEIPATDDLIAPSYMEEVYDWAYINPRNVELLDRQFVVDVLLFGNARRLMAAALNEIAPAHNVLMAAHVYGDFVTRLADRVGPAGHLEVVDITPIQVDHAHRKIGHLSHVKIHQADAATHVGGPFDMTLSFFLLHEVPDGKKRGIVDSLLSKVEPGGKAVFVDYHNPKWWQPVRYILSFVNDKLEPFAKSLWHREIREFASESEAFTWEKQTYFGGVYQKVVAHRKA
jgi:SAM-dependent methyltransferase